MLLFTHGIDLAKDIARNCGVTASVDWSTNSVTLISQDLDLIAQAVERFNKLEHFYVLFLIYHINRLESSGIAIRLLADLVAFG